MWETLLIVLFIWLHIHLAGKYNRRVLPWLALLVFAPVSTFVLWCMGENKG